MTAEHVGRIIDGRYRLERLLGEGAEGQVYEAKDVTDDHVVAVKILRYSHDASISARLREDVDALQALDHENIATVLELGFDESLRRHFLVTEYTGGVPLSERMREMMGTELVSKIALQVASALHHAHDRGVLHRDLKPENVMLTKRGGRVEVAKVLDFGLSSFVKARVRGERSEAPATGSQAGEGGRHDAEDRDASGVVRVWGTPLYMSPEQWLDDEITRASDVYSLGVMMFELLEGRLPFDGESVEELRSRMETSGPPEQESEFTPEEVKVLVARMLSQDPNARPTTDEIIDVLSRHVGELADVDDGLEEESWRVDTVDTGVRSIALAPGPEREERAPRGTWWIAALVLGFAVLVGWLTLRA